MIRIDYFDPAVAVRNRYYVAYMVARYELCACGHSVESHGFYSSRPTTLRCIVDNCVELRLDESAERLVTARLVQDIMNAGL